MIVHILMITGISFSLYKLYLHHTKPDITPYFWYKGPAMYQWQMNQDQDSRNNYKAWRDANANMINRSNQTKGVNK